MNTIARLPVQERRLLFTETGRLTGIDPFHVEKDYWVCWTLSVLFNEPGLNGALAFRGGTSLSKGWGCIERFSEDIDLAIGRGWLGKDRTVLEAESLARINQGQAKRLRKECRAAIREQIVPSLQRAAAEVAEGGAHRIRLDEDFDKARDPFVVWFEYPVSELTSPERYFRSAVKIELSGRADGVPVEPRRIVPMVLESFPNLGGSAKVVVACVHPHRTFWEKLALIHERNTEPGGSAPAERMSRHLYDIHRIWTTGVLPGTDLCKDAMFRTVMRHRSTFFDYGWVDHMALEPQDLRIIPPVDTIRQWEADYRLMHSMFFRDPPAFDLIVQTLRQITGRLSGVSA